MATLYTCKDCKCEKEAKHFEVSNSGGRRHSCRACRYQATKAKNDRAKGAKPRPVDWPWKYNGKVHYDSNSNDLSP